MEFIFHFYFTSLVGISRILEQFSSAKNKPVKMSLKNVMHGSV